MIEFKQIIGRGTRLSTDGKGLLHDIRFSVKAHRIISVILSGMGDPIPAELCPKYSGMQPCIC